MTMMTERERHDQQVTASIEMVDFYGQYLQLMSLLPQAKDAPQFLKCDGCGFYLGAVKNSCGIAFGHFDRKNNQWSRLIGCTTLVGRQHELKCPACGFVTRWRHQRKRQKDS